MYILNDGECELTSGGDPTVSYSYGTVPDRPGYYPFSPPSDRPNTGYASPAGPGLGFSTTYYWTGPNGNQKTWTEIQDSNGNPYEAIYTVSDPNGSVVVIDKKVGY